MKFYKLYESYDSGNYKYYQVIPYDFWGTIKLLKSIKGIKDFIKNGSFNEKKIRKIAFKKNMEAFNKRKNNHWWFE